MSEAGGRRVGEGGLASLVDASQRLAATAGRNDKVAIIAEALRAAVSPGLAASYLAGTPRQTRLEVGWASLQQVDAPAAATSSLSLVDVDRALTALVDAGGPGSRGVRHDALQDLLVAATEAEQTFLTRLILGDMAQGALAGLVVKGIARAAEVPEAVVRRALMLSADLAGVTTLALDGGRTALEGVVLQVGTPIQPMLASTAAGVGEAVEAMGSAVVEWKLDGARVQVHLRDGDVTVYTRNLNDITGRSPDVVAMARALPTTSAILDAEVLAMGSDGRPSPFQDTMSAFSADAADDDRVAMHPFAFDLLHVDGEDLIDLPLTERRRRLVGLVPDRHVVPSHEVTDPAAGEAVLAEALARGHEGVMVKDPASTYDAGRRGKGWRKVKPVRTLDLVVLAVEWGSGRRQGLLSNIHLGAVDDRPGHDGFVMLGKTFKGMTDEVLAWQTARFLELETRRDGRVVHVRPEQVVEIAVDGIQASRRYPGWVALRFARVLRYRDDKAPADADVLSTVRALGTP
jgi:DNA ligase 1